MRILFVNERGAFFGGVEQHMAHAVTELRQRGHECVLAYGCEDGSRAEAFRAPFNESLQEPALAPGSPSGGDPGWLGRTCERYGVDTVYLHKLPSLPDTSLLPVGVRVVQMVHDHDLCCPRRHKYFAATTRACDRASGWRCYLDGAFVARDRSSRLGIRLLSVARHRREMRRHWRLDALLVGSTFMREELLMNGAPPERVHIVPPAVPGPVSVAAAPPEPDLVLFAGQLIRGKGVDRLLKAMAPINRPWRIAIAGRGNHESALRALASRLGIGDRVTFEGWLAPTDLQRLYQRASVVAVPSRWPEPFGMVGLEAMRHARPVVAFDVGGIGDWLQDGRNGCLAPDGDVTRFGREIAALLDSPSTARRLGANGRLALATRFDFPTCMDALERHLRRPQAEVRRAS